MAVRKTNHCPACDSQAQHDVIFDRKNQLSRPVVSDQRDDDDVNKISRRRFLKGASIAGGGAAMMGAVPGLLRSGALSAVSDKPEKTDLTIGFIPLTDCASVVMAHELGLYKKYGLNVTASKEASWAAAPR